MNRSPIINAAILAAGEGKRLKLSTSKPLAPLCGQRLVDYPIQEFISFLQEHQLSGSIGIIVGHQKEALLDHLASTYSQSPIPLLPAVQEQQLGTADAMRSYFQGAPSLLESDYTLVLCADTPLIRATDLGQLLTTIMANPDIEGVVATFQLENPTGYGRIIRSHPGLHIVEEKDASPEIKKIQEVNSGLYIFKTAFLQQQLQKIDNKNTSGEFYLTDVFQDHRKVVAVLFPEGDKFVGVNDLEQLEWVEKKIRQEKIRNLRQKGVRFLDSLTTFIDWKVEVGEKTVVYPHTFLEGTTTVGANAIIGPGCVITDTKLADEVVIKAYSCIESSSVAERASIGPFAHLRPESDIGPDVKVGNFVETKKAKLAQGSKVSHLSYIGDALIGEESNIGCGFITCNYDGANKHQTIIGKGSFIGSDCQAVAPITIGDNCFVAAGSTITENIPSDGFAIARSKQVTKLDVAKRFLRKKIQTHHKA